MKHWDERAEVLLANARRHDVVPAGARKRVKASIAVSLGLAATGAATAYAKLPLAAKAGSTALAAASAGVPLGPSTFLLPMTIGLALGLSAVAPSEPAKSFAPPMHSTDIEQKFVPAVRHPTAHLPPAAIPSTPPLPGAPPASSAARPRASNEAAANVSTSSESAPSESATSIKEEVSALEHARVVLRQGDAELSLRLLNRYREDFPHGALGFEASVTRAVALCRVGRVNEAFGLLAQLESSVPGSGAVAQARSACGAALPTAPVKEGP